MSDEHNPNKGELVLSRDRSLATRRSGLVKRGLQLIPELKRPQLRVLVCDDQDTFVEFFSACINEVIRGKYDLKVMWTLYADELLELAHSQQFDIFILILNNVCFRPLNLSVRGRVENVWQLVTHLRTMYRRPVIALSGQPDKSPFSEENAKLAGASFFFPLPFKVEDFKEAIEKCLDTLSGFDGMPQ